MAEYITRTMCRSCRYNNTQEIRDPEKDRYCDTCALTTHYVYVSTGEEFAVCPNCDSTRIEIKRVPTRRTKPKTGTFNCAACDRVGRTVPNTCSCCKAKATVKRDFGWLCNECHKHWYTGVNAPTRAPTQTGSTKVEPSTNVESNTNPNSKCTFCKVGHTVPNICGTTCREAHELLWCGSCLRLSHACGNKVLDQPHSDGHVRCISCYADEIEGSRAILSEKLKELEKLIVPGGRCPSCGDRNYVDKVQEGVALRVCTIKLCEQVWHLCPTVPGMIMFKMPGKPIHCIACNPHKQAVAEERSIPCIQCKQAPVTPCECKFKGKCGHYRCGGCNLTWHDCMNHRDPYRIRPIGLPNVPINAHLACVDCQGEPWMIELVAEYKTKKEDNAKREEKPPTSYYDLD